MTEAQTKLRVGTDVRNVGRDGVGVAVQIQCHLEQISAKCAIDKFSKAKYLTNSKAE
jgi:hypothetical protein